MTDPAVQSDTPGPADTTVPRPFHRHPGDGWVQCAHGHRHWGLHGAAGLLLARRAHQGAIDAVVLQHRALWSDLADLLEHSLPCAELTRAWLDAAACERRHSQVFDDHGLAHRTTAMGDSFACLPVAELLARCPELAEQAGCAHCRECGLTGLRRAALRSHARAPDPDAIVAALRGRHGPLAQDIALHLAARFSLSVRPCPLEHGLGASWLTRLTQRPVPAPHALRAVRELLRARPALADAPDMFAALIRQAGPRAQHGDLPRPTAPPFAALGELVLHLPDLAALLAPWHDPAVVPAAWHPDPFESHVHRTVATPWRRQLARRAADDPEAALWLARLGDLEALTRISRRPFLALAHDIRRQHALRDRPADVPCDMSLLTSAVESRAGLRPGDGHTVDLALLREAARALTPPHDPAALAPALELLIAAGLPAEVWEDILDRLLPPAGPPAPDVLAKLETVRQQVLRDPTSRPNHRKLVQSAIRAGAPEAFTYATAWSQADPDHAPALLAVADLLAARSDPAAMRAYGSAVEVNPFNLKLQTRLADAYAGKGDITRSCAHRRAVVSIDPVKADNHLQLARCLATLGRQDLVLDAVGDGLGRAKGNVAELYASQSGLRPARPRPVTGKLKAMLTWNGAGDLDVAFIDNRGRRLSAIRPEGVTVEQLGNGETAGLASVAGTVSVEVTRFSGQGPVSGELKLRTPETTRVFPFTIDQGTLRLANVTFNGYYRGGW